MYTQFTRAQLRALFKEQLGEAASTFWRDDELNRYIQMGLRFYNACTGLWRGRSTLTTIANLVAYGLPSPITMNLRVSFNDQQLTPASFHDMDMGRPLWQSETTSMGGDIPATPQVYIPFSLTVIAIWPADATGNNTLVYDGILSTPVLTSDSQKVDLGEEDLTDLLDYLQHLAVFKEGGAEFQATMSRFQSFMQNIGKRNGMLAATSPYRALMGTDQAYEQVPRMAGAQKAGSR